MSLRWKLILANLKSYVRESLLVILSTMVSVSLLTAIGLSMHGFYRTIGDMLTKDPQVNAWSWQVREPHLLELVLNDLDVLDYLDLRGDEIYDETHGMGIGPSMAYECKDSMNQYICEGRTIIEGRASENQHELVIPNTSKLAIGDVVTVVHHDRSEAGTHYEFTVVGRSKNDYSGSYLLKKGEKTRTQQNVMVSLAFKPGVKHIDKFLNQISETHPEIFESRDESRFEGSPLFSYNSDYNFFTGHQSKPSSFFYTVLGSTAVMMLIVAAAMMSLIVNSMVALAQRKSCTYGVLRTVGMTQPQLKNLMMLEGFGISAVGVALGLGFGMFMKTSLFVSIEAILKSLMHQDAPPFSVNHGTSLLIIALIACFSLVLVFIALMIMAKRLFKRSAVDTIKQEGVLLKKAPSLKKHVPLELAQIQSKRTRTKRGIQVSIFLSIVLFLTIQSWTSSLMASMNQTYGRFDTEITISDRDHTTFSDLKKESHEVQTLMNPYHKKIKEDVVIYTSSIHEIDPKHYFEASYLDYLSELAEDGSTISAHVRVLDDPSFKELLSDAGLSKDGSVIAIPFVDIPRSRLKEPDYVGPILKPSELKNMAIKRHDISYPLPVDHVLDKIPSTFEFMDIPRGGVVFITSESWIEQQGYEQVSFYRAEHYFKTELEIQEVRSIKSDVSEHDSVMFISEIENSVIVTQLKRTVSKVISVVFGLIMITVLLSLVNTALTQSQMRARTIASLKGLGMTQFQLTRMHFYESIQSIIAPSISGLVFGSIVSYGLFMFSKANFMLDETIPFKVELSTFIMLFGCIAMIIVVQTIVLYFGSKGQDLIKKMKNI